MFIKLYKIIKKIDKAIFIYKIDLSNKKIIILISKIIHKKQVYPHQEDHSLDKIKYGKQIFQ